MTNGVPVCLVAGGGSGRYGSTAPGPAPACPPVGTVVPCEPAVPLDGVPHPCAVPSHVPGNGVVAARPRVEGAVVALDDEVNGGAGDTVPDAPDGDGVAACGEEWCAAGACDGAAPLPPNAWGRPVPRPMATTQATPMA